MYINSLLKCFLKWLKHLICQGKIQKIGNQDGSINNAKNLNKDFAGLNGYLDRVKFLLIFINRINLIICRIIKVNKLSF